MVATIQKTQHSFHVLLWKSARGEWFKGCYKNHVIAPMGSQYQLFVVYLVYALSHYMGHFLVGMYMLYH